MPIETKADSSTVQKRVDIIIDLIIDGNTISKIKRFVKTIGIENNVNEQPWNVSDRQLDKYVAKAHEQIKNDSKIDKSAEIGRCLNRYNKLYNKSYSAQDYKTCALITDKVAKLFGLNLEKPEVTVINGVLINKDDIPQNVQDKLL